MRDFGSPCHRLEALPSGLHWTIHGIVILKLIYRRAVSWNAYLRIASNWAIQRQVTYWYLSTCDPQIRGQWGWLQHNFRHRESLQSSSKLLTLDARHIVCVNFKQLSLKTSSLVRDMNVHYQNSLLFAAALQKAGTRFEMSFYPDSGHSGFGEDAGKRMYDFTLKCLLK